MRNFERNNRFYNRIWDKFKAALKKRVQKLSIIKYYLAHEFKKEVNKSEFLPFLNKSFKSELNVYDSYVYMRISMKKFWTLRLWKIQ